MKKKGRRENSATDLLLQVLNVLGCVLCSDFNLCNLPVKVHCMLLHLLDVLVDGICLLLDADDGVVQPCGQQLVTSQERYCRHGEAKDSRVSQLWYGHRHVQLSVSE